ncbi:MAG: Rieske 2Fe-2S domain-containing protein [Planctomycetes bacterium]|nr:Rieske 2Fe-2S domain-containing protein [Planctomycetota bacterium]
MPDTDPRDFDTGLAPEELEPARPRPIATPWGSFALFLVDGRVLCVQSFCPHLGGPLFQGTVAGSRVTCPWHEWIFSLETGRRVDLAGRLLGGSVLARCDVERSARGTIVLRAPERRPSI